MTNQQKYRLSNGDCKYCGQPPLSYHLPRCLILQVMEQHHEIAHSAVLETMSQLDKWDVQSHPMGVGPSVRLLQYTDVNLDLRTGAELEYIFRERCEAKAKDGSITYFDILLEEVFEAGGASTAEELEEELVQVAAVAIAMAATSKRKRGA
jgi:hypothetical protein